LYLLYTKLRFDEVRVLQDLISSSENSGGNLWGIEYPEEEDKPDLAPDKDSRALL
jgi:hypothetical protein